MNAYEIRSNKLVEYMKLHLISLEQDYAEIDRKIQENVSPWEADALDTMIISINGQIIATRHLLSVVADILGIQLEEK